MCMAIPARVLEVNGERAYVAGAQQRMEVGRALAPELDVGDWVLVNSGQIVTRLTPDEAEAIRQVIRELQEFMGQEPSV